MDFPIPRLDKLNNQQLFIVFVALLLVFGLVSSFMLAPKEDESCCGNVNLVVNKNRNAVGLFEKTYWTIEKVAGENNLINASSDDISYTLNITEIKTENGVLVLRGNVTVHNNGNNKTAYLGNVVENLLVFKSGTGQGAWLLNATNVLDYYDSDSVNTCDVNKQDEIVTFSRGLGSGKLSLTDPNGNDPFAMQTLYSIPPKTTYIFDYSATYNIEELNMDPSKKFREQIIFTFLNTSSNGGGSCYGVDVTGDGIIDLELQSDDSVDSPSSDFYLPSSINSTRDINLSDMINFSPDSSIVTVPDFTINLTQTLPTDGSSTWEGKLRGSKVDGTSYLIYLNSTATCQEGVDGITLIRNKAWIDAADMEVIAGSPTYSQISFICGYVEPPPILVGDVCTFTQDLYGKFNTTAFRTMNGSFSSVYTTDLQVGDSMMNWLKLTSGDAILEFLPQYGTPSYLTANLTDPGEPTDPLLWSTSARQFAGEVVALALNVDLSDAGVMPQKTTDIFGDLTVKNTGTSFDGKSVRQTLDIANCLLSGSNDCSGYTASDIPMVSEVLVTLNMNYYNCQNDFNHTDPEDNTPPIIWSVEAIPDLLYPGQMYMVRVNATDDVGVDKVNITVNTSSYALQYNATTGFYEISAINAPASGTHTIYVNAYDGVGNSDYDDSEYITVDNEIPYIHLDGPANNSFITAGTMLYFTVSDPNLDSVKYNYTMAPSPGSALSDFYSPYDISTTGWEDGLYTVYIWANDTVGNYNDKWYRFTIDSTAPLFVSFTANDTVFPTNTVVNFTALVTEANSLKDDEVEVSCTNGSYTFDFTLPCSGGPSSWTCTDDILVSEPDGEYDCTATAEDEAGNSVDSGVLEITIDSTPPTITLNSPSPSGSDTYVQPGEDINLTVTNGVYDDLEEVWYSTDGGITNTTLSKDDAPYFYITMSGECVHTYDIWAKDSAGNVRHVTYVFNQDGIDPVISSVIETPSTMYPSDPYMINATVSDNKMLWNVTATVNGVDYPMTNDTATHWYTTSPVAPGPGTYYVNITAYDKAGNLAYNDTTSILVQTPPGPVISLVSPSNGATVKNTVPVNVSITSGGINPLDARLFNSSTNPTLRDFDLVSGDYYIINLSGYSDGTYTFFVYANDTFPREANATYWFKIDSTAPVVTSFAANDTVFPTNTVVNFTALVTEANSLKDDEVEVSCTNGSYTFDFTLPCSGGPSSWTCTDDILVSEPDGEYDCTATAEDEAGNSDTSDVLDLIIDSTPPVIVLNNPSNGSYVIPGTPINYSVTNGVYDLLDEVHAQVDGEAYSTLSDSDDPLYYVDTSEWEDGIHCVNITAEDTAGNDASLLDKCFLVDTTPPVIHSVDPQPDYVLGSSKFDIKVNATDTPFPELFKTNGTVEVTAGYYSYELEYNSSSGFWEGTGLEYAPPPESCGYVSLLVNATDPAGNSATDNSAQLASVGCYPEIVLISPENNTAIAAGTILNFDILHPFTVYANYTVDSMPPETLNSPLYDINTSGWDPGTYDITIDVVDIYGYGSSEGFTFTILPLNPPPPPPDNGKSLAVSASQICPGDDMLFTITHKGEGIDGINVKLLYYGTPKILYQKTTNSSGQVVFPISYEGYYEATVVKSGDYEYKNNPYTFTYSECPPYVPPTPPCEDDADCPSGQVCEEGKCNPPECDDDLDCPGGEVCVSGNCEPVPPECTEDSDCAQGEICSSGECIEAPEKPECDSDADCESGYKCDGGECKPLPGIDGTPPEEPVGNPNSEMTLDFNVTANGTLPLHNVGVTVDGGLEILSSDTVPLLNPGESAIISVKVRIGDLPPGDYSVTAVYTSDEVSSSDQFDLKITEIVSPGAVFADPLLCLIPLLLLLLLALLWWFFLRRKIVTDAANLSSLASADKLGFGNKYYVSDAEYGKLGKKLKEKCTAVTVGKARVDKVVSRFGFPRPEATLFAIAQKVGANRILFESKAFDKYIAKNEGLEGVKFLSPKDMLKKK